MSLFHRCTGALLSVLLIAFMVLAGKAEAAIYSCRDANGGVHFTNAPSGSNCTAFVKKKRTHVHSMAKGSGKSGNPGLYEKYIKSASVRHRVDPNLIRAIIQVESDFDRYAVSNKGAQGLMQLMPETAKELQVVNPFNPRENIEGGTKYVRKLLTLFKGDLTLTLAAYNAGPTLVRKLNRIPRIPETVRYVKKVLHQYKRYRGGAILPPSSTITVGGLELASSR